jgi:sec-independent protein translocase protein TatB
VRRNYQCDTLNELVGGDAAAAWMRKEVAQMQMFGVGVLELLVILILATIVVGPDKMPQLAADLGRWIRQTRAYARHLMGDFNEVVRELEKEAGASREDWQEIANVVKRNTGAIGQELSRFGRDLEEQQRELTDIKELSAERPSNVVPIEQKPAVVEDEAEDLDVVPEPVASVNGDSEASEPEEEKPWYVPERASRRRSSE